MKRILSILLALSLTLYGFAALAEGFEIVYEANTLETDDAPGAIEEIEEADEPAAFEEPDELEETDLTDVPQETEEIEPDEAETEETEAEEIELDEAESEETEAEEIELDEAETETEAEEEEGQTLVVGSTTMMNGNFFSEAFGNNTADQDMI